MNIKFKNLLLKIKSYLTIRLFIGIIIGAVAGYAYYYYVGCQSGSCPITSNPVNMILYGSLFGGLLFFKEKKNKEEIQNENK